MEQWKDIPGYETVYQASTLGRVRRVATGRILATASDSKGYTLTHLCKDGVRWLTQTHRVVAMAFITPDLGGLTVNHINGVKNDNRLANLEVATHKDNIHHAIAAGLRNTTGTKNPNATLTEAHVRAIKRRIAAGDRTADIARDFGVEPPCIHKIRKGRTWRHIT